MNTPTHKSSRSRRILLSAAAALGLMIGGVAVASAATGPKTAPPVTVTHIVDAQEANDVVDAVDTPEENDVANAPEANDSADEVDGVDCEDGVDAMTGAQCDGGPTANATDGADDATETGK